MQRMTPPRGMVPLGPQVWYEITSGNITKPSVSGHFSFVDLIECVFVSFFFFFL